MMINTNELYMMQLNYRIHKILMQLGICQSLKGYKFIYHGISIILDYPDEEIYITKDLYIRLAKQFNCNPWSIERNIRTAIKKIPISEYRNIVFPLSGDIHYTNKEFLLHIARYIKIGGL